LFLRGLFKFFKHIAQDSTERTIAAHATRHPEWVGGATGTWHASHHLFHHLLYVLEVRRQLILSFFLISSILLCHLRLLHRGLLLLGSNNGGCDFKLCIEVLGTIVEEILEIIIILGLHLSLLIFVLFCHLMK
jgi:hypothetical protein